MDKRAERLFDKRVVERNMRKGHVTRAEYEAFLKGLPDGESNVEYVSHEDADDDLDDDLDDDVDDDSEN